MAYVNTQDVTERAEEAGTQDVRDSGTPMQQADQPRGDPGVCFAGHESVHLGLSDFHLEFREPQGVLSLSWSHKTESCVLA